MVHINITSVFWQGESFRVYFIPSSEFNAYLKQIKVILSTVKKKIVFLVQENKKQVTEVVALCKNSGKTDSLP